MSSGNFFFDLRLVRTRINFSRFTTAFFFLAVLHCFIQIALQVLAFNVNTGALHLLENIFALGLSSNTVDGFAIWQNNTLSVCNGVPNSENCQIVWQMQNSLLNTTIPNISTNSYVESGVGGAEVVSPTLTEAVAFDDPTPSLQADEAETETITIFVEPTGLTSLDTPGAKADNVQSHKKRSPTLSVKHNATSGQFEGVIISDPSFPGGHVLANTQCITSLQMPIQSLRNTERVDLTFIAFQVWVLGMSVVAILNESIPHLIASLLTHLLATVWSGYQVEMTADFHTQFGHLIVDGPCQANLLPDFWNTRRDAEIAIVALNAAVFLIMSFLSYKLVKAFGWQTFKRIGASFAINRIYTLVLALSIAIQLSVFFIGADVALWIDQLYNGNVAMYTEHRSLWAGVYIGVLVVLFPWLAMGWFAVRRENRLLMHGFLLTGVVMISGWVLMFASTSFLWTFKAWDFFAAITVAAAFLLLAALALGITCRLNFGQGLPRYLNARHPDANGLTFVPVDSKLYDEEKVEFPSVNPIPTFSMAFGSGMEVPPPAEMQFAPARPAPGISMHSRVPSDAESDLQRFLTDRQQQHNAPRVMRPAPAVTRTPSRSSQSSNSSASHNRSQSAQSAIDRSDSTGSQRSQLAQRAKVPPQLTIPPRNHQRSASEASSQSSVTIGRNRWLIE